MFGSFSNMLLEVLASSIGGSEFGANIRLGGAQQDYFFRNLSFRNKADGGKQSLIWVQEMRTRPQCRVTTPLWAPGADSGQRGKKRNRGRNSDQKMTAVRDPGVAGR